MRFIPLACPRIRLVKLSHQRIIPTTSPTTSPTTNEDYSLGEIDTLQERELKREFDLPSGERILVFQ